MSPSRSYSFRTCLSFLGCLCLLASSRVCGQTDSITQHLPLSISPSALPPPSFNDYPLPLIIDLPFPFSDSLTAKQKKQRPWLIGGIHVAAYGSSLIALNNTWYKDYAKQSFHTFNDSREWLQVDKTGHAWSTYNLARASTSLWRWSGMDYKKSALIGGLSSMGYLTVIEFMDAHSAKWGWSWSDVVANVFGTGLYMSQELGWKEQRVQLKFSFHQNSYGDEELHARANDLFGKSPLERMLKDYNAQTYWLSINPWSFNKNSQFPRWLNIAVGYGAAGMFGGFENKWTDNIGNEIVRTDQVRKRQFYLSPDIDFTKIPVRGKFWRTTFSILNAFKFPAPALMLDSKGKFKAYAFYF
jgi:uncharacterized protein YfiM (DUF2279 family)